MRAPVLAGRFAIAVGTCAVAASIFVLSEPVVGQASAPLVQSVNLVYEGAFRLPTGNFGVSNFGYGGTAMTYNPTNNSLFMVGHDWNQAVAEVTIPASTNSANLAALSTATVLQPFVDPTEGKMYQVGTGQKIGGLMVSGGKLYGTVFLSYDASGVATTSHFSRPLQLNVTGQVKGLYAVGNVNPGIVAGAMAPIPSEWQSALGGPSLTGQCCVNIISRTSSGPSASVFNPADLGVTSPVAAKQVLYYPLSNPLAQGDTTNGLFNLATAMGGFIFPSGTRSVLFFGRQGVGPYCYGLGTDCNDPSDGSKGTHAYPYQPQVWAYDVNDLVAVKNGTKTSYSVRPYATWKLTMPFIHDSQRIKGVAYDPQAQRVWVSAYLGDGDNPVIHSFKLTVGAALTVPGTPTGLHIIP